ncbi:P-loop containing nucleoside triphosphate hydrolase protein [Crepidotus variabilis]|uniref:P-loop containing nucleoside triphosphate hydrolase protein n=1 Tax=Crepidotus variabilis TaxID=179855 RepID=A0A9P6ETH1_9AGAR|nr:P-loop containing nucleoside triphosphate hydrolase protein [Crepidotus variabilis]
MLIVLFSAKALMALYPKHSLVLSSQYGLDPFSFPAARVTPLEKTPLITSVFFNPLARSTGIPGVLLDQVTFGSFKVTWKEYEFIHHAFSYSEGFGTKTINFILHEGPEAVTRLFLSSIGSWQYDLHEEIWVFDQGFWNKQHSLWKEVQKADWKDVILKDEFKKELQKDVYGFFKSEAIYKELAIPWKRGLIMHGPPGNGKTISLKAIMKTCEAKGFIPLYVKSFQSWRGEEGSMTEVFNKARSLSPCVVILEDLDSLINDRNRSFFLNQLDGLEGNDGLLIIGTTNHFDRLDPGLSTRPSRFDRKYLFDDPDKSERKLYALYWQKKLASNEEIKFPDSLVDDFVHWTDRFSFAYLKEAFVSSLVLLAGMEDEDKPSFDKLLKAQVDTLRKQLDKPSLSHGVALKQPSLTVEPTPVSRGQPNATGRDVRVILDSLSDYIDKTDFGASQPKFYRSPASPSEPVPDAHMTDTEKRVRQLFDSLSQSLEQASEEQVFTSRRPDMFPSPPRMLMRHRPGHGQPVGRSSALPQPPVTRNRPDFRQWLSGFTTELDGEAEQGTPYYIGSMNVAHPAQNELPIVLPGAPVLNPQGTNGMTMRPQHEDLA